MGLALYYVGQTVRPSAKRVVKNSLVDTSILMAGLLAEDVATKNDINQQLKIKLSDTFATANSLLWYHQKNKSTYHLYITDTHGTVIYDSIGQNVGADFSRWNDVYLTLRGKYGARSTDMGGHSVMYVASPMMYRGKLVGVLSVGKPTQTLVPYIDKSVDEIIKIILTIMAITLATATFMAWWLRHSINSVNLYTKGLAKETPPHFYLGQELNELMASIHAMKDTIENRAYVTEYVHTLTHELKSPLTAIRASGEILSGELNACERKQFTDIILTQTDKLTALVDKLLNLAKLEQPNFKLDKSQLNIDDIITHCLNLKSANIKQLNKNVIFHKSGISINADEFWFMQAILNILENAIFYGKTYIKIDVKHDNKNIIISIINDSEKLDDFVIKKAFDRYFSMGNAYAHVTQKSTGLGLTLVKQVVELHGGTVAFRQDNDDGKNIVSVVMVLPK